MYRRILIFFSVAIYGIILCHNIVPHHHHDEVGEIEHQEDSDAHDHNVFSFGTLDEAFLPVKNITIVPPDFALQLFSISDITLITGISFFKSQNEYVTYQEFPPPENFHNSLPLRAPPFLIS